MSGFVLSPRAQEDLNDIWDYTARRWDDAQAEQYTRDIWNAIEALASGRQRGQACSDVRAGYFRYTIGSHILFFRRRNHVVDVVRILHQSMDVDRHL